MGQIFPGGDEGMVKDGVKEQASGTLRLYTLLNFAGSGCFVDYMKVWQLADTKTASCHNANLLVTGGMIGCYDCGAASKHKVDRHHDNYLFSVDKVLRIVKYPLSPTNKILHNSLSASQQRNHHGSVLYGLSRYLMNKGVRKYEYGGFLGL